MKFTYRLSQTFEPCLDLFIKPETVNDSSATLSQTELPLQKCDGRINGISPALFRLGDDDI